MFQNLYLVFILAAVAGPAHPKDRESALALGASIKSSEVLRLHENLIQARPLINTLISDLDKMALAHDQASQFLTRDIEEGKTWRESLLGYARTVQPDWINMTTHQAVAQTLSSLPQSLPPPQEEAGLRASRQTFSDELARVILRSHQSYKNADAVRRILIGGMGHKPEESATTHEFINSFLRTLNWYERKMRAIEATMRASELKRDSLRREIPAIWRTNLERRLQHATTILAEKILTRSQSFVDGSDLSATSALTLAKMYHRSWHAYHSMHCPNLCMRSSAFALAILEDLGRDAADGTLHPEVAIEMERNLMVSRARLVALNVKCANAFNKNPEVKQIRRDHSWASLMQKNRKHPDIDCRTLFLTDPLESPVDAETRFSKLFYKCQDTQPDA